jgi:hypothetical protein
MSTTTQSVISRKCLDQKVRVLDEACSETFVNIAWERDQDRHDFERFAEITAGIDRAMLLQERARHLDWRVERLARGARYWSSPWWRRGWLRLRGRAAERWVKA